MAIKCITEGCDEELSPKKEAPDLCKKCKSAAYYWKKKRPAQILFRRGRLKVFSNRLAEWFTDEGRKK